MVDEVKNPMLVINGKSVPLTGEHMQLIAYYNGELEKYDAILKMVKSALPSMDYQVRAPILKAIEDLEKGKYAGEFMG